jgi:hypothetical protein
MGLFDSLFGKKKGRSATTPQYPSGSKSGTAVFAANPAPVDDFARLAKATELEVKLGRYYQSHPDSDNELLIKVALNLGAYVSATTEVLALPRNSPLTDAQRTRLASLLKDTSSNVPTFVEEENGVTNAMSSAGVTPADALRLFTRHLNLYFDVGSTLLLRREMAQKGFSQQMIDRELAKNRPNLF